MWWSLMFYFLFWSMVAFNRYGFAAALTTLGKFQWDQLECKLDKEKRLNDAVQRFMV